ncbi:MAG: hypothetical protein AB7U20_04745 [Planctomycetaceae bacterium]
MTADLMAPGRLEQGYVIVLPGVEGQSFLNRSIVRGLVAAGVPYGIEIHDWTAGLLGYFRNLRDSRRHRDQAEEIAGKIARYRDAHPSQPIYVIGHSGGGAMTLFTLERLPGSICATGGILLVPAISPAYDIGPALARTTRGLWNFSSWGDFFIVGLGTLVCGTCDGKHRPSAGMVGFSPAVRPENRPGGHQRPTLHEVPYRPAMLRHGGLGGHFTLVNPVFVRHWIAPIVLGLDVPR